MSTSAPSSRTQQRRSCQCFAFALALTAALAGCGGGGDEASVLAQAAQRAGAELTARVTSVRLEGCVVDEFFIPRTGTAVRLLSTDGRLLGHASSNKDGVFTLQAPAQQTVSVTVDKAGGEALVVPTGHTNLSVGACLRDPHA